MNRRALKLPCAVLFGVVLGGTIGRAPWWGGGAGAEAGSGQLQGTPVQSGRGAWNGGGLTGSKGEAGAGRAGGKPSPERLEMLAAGFRIKGADGDGMAAAVAMTLEAGKLSAEEFGPLIALLAEDAPSWKYEPAWKAVQLLAVRWAMVDPKAALSLVLERPDLIRRDRQVMSTIMQELAKVDLPAAKTALEQVGFGDQWELGREVVRMLQHRDARAALAYARELGDERAEADVLSHMAEDDPRAAAAELTSGGEDLRPAVERIAFSLLIRDRWEFEAWIGSLQDPGQRAAARSQALTMDAANDPRGTALAAAAWLAGEPEAAAQCGNLPADIVKQWMKAEAAPSEVAAWAAALPAGPFQDRALSEVGRLWSIRDTLAASAWAASLPGGEGRDNTVCSLVERIRYESPDDAFEWARTLGNPSLRYETLKSTLRIWAGKDSAAAQAAVETLPAGEQGYLVEALQKEEKAKTNVLK